VPHQLDGRAIGPLGILEHNERRPGPRGVQQLSCQGIDGFAPDLPAIAAIRFIHGSFNNPYRGRELLHDGPERIVAVQRRTLEDLPCRLVPGGGVGQRLQQAGFADAGFTGQQHRLAAPRFRLLPGTPQCRQLRLAPDDRPQIWLGAGTKAALAGLPPQNAKQRYRLVMALEPVLANGFDHKAGPEQPPRRFGDHDFTRAGGLLQASREVRGGADHRMLPRRAFANQVTDDDQPGGDADPAGQLLADRGCQPGDSVGDGERGSDRPLGIVLMRPRPAEIREHAVAHQLGDIAEPADLAGDGVLKRAQYLAHGLGIEPQRQWRRVLPGRRT